MYVIGTAGHVDHGKSSLVEALTGTHPDRLKEEREREMTIDLGFAWLTLPGGEEVGIVDVPGHRDFIENMLSGIGGIDATLFVIAADEGVMPQTREHLAILDLLQIQGGVVALTKIDLVDSSEWLDLVQEDVRRVLQGTVLSDAHIVRVSSRTKTGLKSLLDALDSCLAGRPPRADMGRARLPVDRVFTIAGFGTVVTGTLSDGSLHLGDEVEVLPRALKGRVRGLQTHQRKEDVAIPGSRTAVNVSGLTVDDIRRGDVLAHPRHYHPTILLDLQFRLLPDASQAIRHNSEVKFFIGASEVLARLRLLGVDTLLPGEQGWLQLELVEPVVAVRGDRYIIRRPSPGETLGGGVVVDPHPKGRHKRYSAEIIQSLESLAKGTPEDIFLQALQATGAAPFKDVVSRSSLEADRIKPAVLDLIGRGQMRILDANQDPGNLSPESLVISQASFEHIASRAVEEVGNYHRVHPLRQGMPREELKSRLKIPPRIFNAMIGALVSVNRLAERGTFVLLPGFEIRFNLEQKEAIGKLTARLNSSGYSPPSVKECQAEVGEEVFEAMVELGSLVQVSTEVVFSRDIYEKMVHEILVLLARHGSLTAAQARDHFNTSRRYVLALLEHMDALGLTVRVGDVRRRRE